MYVRFLLLLRNMEDLLARRGSTSATRRCGSGGRFGAMFAAEIRRKPVDRMRAYTHWRWHLDEVYVRVNGVQHYLWRAVDDKGEVLESVVAAAVKHLRPSGLMQMVAVGHSAVDIEQDRLDHRTAASLARRTSSSRRAGEFRLWRHPDREHGGPAPGASRPTPR